MSQATASNDLVELLADCWDQPGLWHECVLGRPQLAPYQEDICRSVVENRVTVVPAAHAVGKSWLAASLVLWWLFTRPGSKVVTTSPSFTQLASVLWGAIKSAHKHSLIPLAGSPTEGKGSPQVLQLSPDWFAIGYSTTNAASFSGYHGNVLVLTDESSDIRSEVWDAIESLGYSRMVCFGNPIRSTGHFKDLYDRSGRGGVHGISVTAFDSPHAHLTQEEVEARGLPSGLTTKTWIDGVRDLYGEDSLYWTTRVLARFPVDDTESLVPRHWVDALNTPENLALARVASKRNRTPRWMGVDPSGGVGSDSSAIVVRDDDLILEVWASPHHGVLEGAKHRLEPVVVAMAKKWQVKGDHVIYDAGGLGSNFGSYLAAAGLPGALAYRGGDSGGARFSNFRTACGFAMKARLDPAMPDCSPLAIEPTPHWQRLREEMLALRTKLEISDHDRPKEALVTKAELCKVLKRSPDLLDALLMSYSRK